MTTPTDFDTELPGMPYTDADRAEDDAELAIGAPAASSTAPAAPAPEKKKPGPAANPNSTRQQKLAAKRAAANKAKPPLTPPRKRNVANAPAVPAPALPPQAYITGAQTMLGWVIRPLAVGSLTLQATAAAAPKLSPARREMLQRQSVALSMDVATISLHADALIMGAAEVANSGNAPWLAAALEKAAKVGPYATLIEAGMTIGLQLLVNHGVMPASEAFGTMTPEQLAAAAGIPWEETAAEVDRDAPLV